MPSNTTPPQAPVTADSKRLELALSAARMGAFEWDVAKDEFHLSQAGARIYGVEPGVWPGNGGETLIAGVHRDDRDKARDVVHKAIEERRSYELEHRAFRRDDGAQTWVFSAGTPVFDADGKLERVLGVSQDITERKAAEAQRETLVAELDHRVKNVLASVQSLAFQSARKAASLDGFLKNFAGRLKSMASAHALLTATRWRGGAVRHIAAGELGGLAPGQTRWEGPDLVLTPRATNALSLALHELATNAVKFGALSVEAGHVDVHWRRLKDGGFELVWLESGGPTVSAPTRQGFGATLLERVTGRELGGEAKVEYLASGVRVTLRGEAAVIVETGEPETPQAPQPPPEEKVAGASAGDTTADRAAKVKGMRVMIVEDALLLSLELEAGLTEAGVKVIAQAADVLEALSMIDLPIEAAVLDANLNGKSVEPVAHALAARHIPFIFATGYGDNQSAPQGFEAPIIRKPYDVGQVAAALAVATGRA